MKCLLLPYIENGMQLIVSSLSSLVASYKAELACLKFMDDGLLELVAFSFEK